MSEDISIFKYRFELLKLLRKFSESQKIISAILQRFFLKLLKWEVFERFRINLILKLVNSANTGFRYIRLLK